MKIDKLCIVLGPIRACLEATIGNRTTCIARGSVSEIEELYDQLVDCVEGPKEEPKDERCEVIEEPILGLSYYRRNLTKTISSAVDDPDFRGYEFKDLEDLRATPFCYVDNGDLYINSKYGKPTHPIAVHFKRKP